MNQSENRFNVGDKFNGLTTDLFNRFEYGSRVLLYILAAFLPLWLIPLPIGLDFSREVTFGILIMASAVLWLLSVLTRGEFRYQHSAILYAAALLFLVVGLSTVFSKAPLVSLFYADASAEKLLTLGYGLILMVLAGSVLASRKDAGVFVFVLSVAGALSGVFTLMQFFFGWTPYRLLASFVQGVDFNVVGTINGLMLFYAALLVLNVGLLFTSAGWEPWVRYLHYVFAVIFLLNLLAVNFRTAWVVLLSSGIFLFGLAFKNVHAFKGRFDTPQILALSLIVISIVMIMVKAPLVDLGLPAEVSPSLRSTWNVTLSVFKEGPKQVILGSGPGTFGLDWMRYKDPAINQTLFWNVRFNQGFSWLATLLVTTGILGVLTFVIFLAVSLLLFLKHMLTTPEGDSGLSVGLFGSFIAMLVSIAAYPANLTLEFTFLLTLGILSALLSKKMYSGEIGPSASLSGSSRSVSPASLDASETKGWRKYCNFTITERIIRFDNPWVVFVSSLAVIFFLSLGLVGIYREIGRLNASFAQMRGVDAFNAGEIDAAISRLERAANLEPRNYRIYQTIAQIRTEKVRRLIQRAAGGENVQQEFQTTVAQAIQNVQQAAQLFPSEPSIWRTQGGLYELLIPFIQGSEKFAIDSYKRAAEFDPLNPSVWVDIGRAGLTFADRVLLLQGQVGAQDRQKLEEVRLAALREAEQALTKASEVKPDFAAAHFLLSQAAIRLGNLQSAIRSTENAKVAAPFDIGVAFQLGLLYYQAGNLERAQAEFERAVALNANYSNARYFLGLIYDRRGDKEAAIAQFEQIEKLNPDNQEVKQILENLRSGKDALSQIVPPAQPPEQRREPPLQTPSSRR
jgi:tetratricopeptide (TPR) repeat protein